MMAFQALRDQRLWPRNTEAGAAGTRTLDGTEALAYVRYRGGPTADLGRIGRQQRFLQELAREATSPAKLPRLPATALAVWRNIDTSMNPLQAARFAIQMRLAGDV
jgi:polyisoprenyl-teichoic acid--peptidoglycan teichoic acid transferase